MRSKTFYCDIGVHGGPLACLAQFWDPISKNNEHWEGVDCTHLLWTASWNYCQWEIYLGKSLKRISQCRWHYILYEYLGPLVSPHSLAMSLPLGDIWVMGFIWWLPPAADDSFDGLWIETPSGQCLPLHRAFAVVLSGDEESLASLTPLSLMLVSWKEDTAHHFSRQKPQALGQWQ